MNPLMGSTALPMFANHFPERLAEIVLLDPPRLFHALYRTLEPLIDPVTKRKICIVRGEAARQRHSALRWQSDPPMAAWLEAVASQCRGQPGAFPPASLSDALSDRSTREVLAAVRKASPGRLSGA